MNDTSHGSITKSDRPLTFFYLFLTVFIWGIQPLAIKIVVEHFSIPFTAFARAVVAFAIFGTLAFRYRNVPLPDMEKPAYATSRPLLWLLIGGIGVAISNLCWNASLRYTTVAACTLLQQNNSICLMLYGILFLSEGCGYGRAAGMLVSVCGLLLVAWNGQDLSALLQSQYFKGNVYAFFAGLGWVPCALAQKVNAHRYSSAAIVAPMFAISALITGIYSLFTPVLTGSFSWLAVSFIILTGALGLGLGNHLFARTMRTIPASIGAAAITACPMISLGASALLLHEPVTTYLLIGAPLTCAGIAIAVLSAR